MAGFPPACWEATCTWNEGRPRRSRCGEKWGMTVREIGDFNTLPKEGIFTLQTASTCVTGTAHLWADDAGTTTFLLFSQSSPCTHSSTLTNLSFSSLRDNRNNPTSPLSPPSFLDFLHFSNLTLPTEAILPSPALLGWGRAG